MLVTTIIAMFLFVIIAPVVNSSIVMRNIEKESEEKDTHTANAGDVEYWAVIAACSEYEDPRNNIPKFFSPISEEKLSAFYYSLLDAPNWKEENMILLLNEQATKNGIVNALGEMSTQVDSNDVFLFSWQGHGSEIPDDNGDEEDGTDEIIVPYDVDIDSGKYLTDDELDFYFSQIDSEAQVLMFESCLSGGLVGDDGDLDKDGRIVIVSTLEDTIGRATFSVGFPMTIGLSVAFNQKYNFHANDKNKDGFISIQEGFNFAKYVIFSELSMFWAGIWVYALIAVGSGAAVMVFLEFLLVETFSYLLSGHFMLNWPHMVDKYDKDLPLVQLISSDESYFEPVPCLPTELGNSYDDINWEDIDIDYWPDLVAFAEVTSQDNGRVDFKGEIFNGPPEYSYHWDFGDGYTSNEQNPTHIYEENGKYTVTFTATDGAGRKDSFLINDLAIKCRSKTERLFFDNLLNKISILKILFTKLNYFTSKS